MSNCSRTRLSGDGVMPRKSLPHHPSRQGSRVLRSSKALTASQAKLDRGEQAQWLSWTVCRVISPTQIVHRFLHCCSCHLLILQNNSPHPIWKNIPPSWRPTVPSLVRYVKNRWLHMLWYYFISFPHSSPLANPHRLISTGPFNNGSMPCSILSRYFPPYMSLTTLPFDFNC
jgi:hypothetical protein